MDTAQRIALMEVRRGLLTVLDGLEQWLGIVPTNKEARRWMKTHYSPTGLPPIEAEQVKDRIDELEDL